MGAKFKSKTHLLNTFFLFLAPFFARLTSKFEKLRFLFFGGVFARLTPKFEKSTNMTLHKNLV
jgi:hypothetical protein